MAKRDSDRPRRVRMVDVAKLAGVSQPTVSFVLNDRRDVAVAEATRRRVLEAAAQLNFRPNRSCTGASLEPFLHRRDRHQRHRLSAVRRSHHPRHPEHRPARQLRLHDFRHDR